MSPAETRKLRKKISRRVAEKEDQYASDEGRLFTRSGSASLREEHLFFPCVSAPLRLCGKPDSSFSATLRDINKARVCRGHCRRLREPCGLLL